jgi:hypothetical protein
MRDEDAVGRDVVLAGGSGVSAGGRALDGGAWRPARLPKGKYWLSDYVATEPPRTVNPEIRDVKCTGTIDLSPDEYSRKA